MTAFGITAQGALAAITSSLLVLFGYPATGVALAGTTALAALLLWGVNWSAQKRQQGGGSPWLVPAVASILVALPLLSLLRVPKAVEGGPEHSLTVLAITVLASVVFLVMWLSSVVDRCYILPRLGGGMGKRPCTDSLDPCWRRITRIWFLHRLVAAITLVAATIAIVALAANDWVLDLNQVVAAAVAAATTVLAGFYLSKLPYAVAMAVNPPLNVGDKVRFAEMFPQPDDCPNYYVSEISLEGVKLVELAGEDERARRESDRPYDRLLELGDVHKLLRVRDTFAPCAGCKGVNLYCGLAHPTLRGS